MKNLIIHNGYIKRSPIHGFGVFASKDIKKGEIVEQAVCPTQVLEPKYEYLDGKVFLKNMDSLSDYRFAGPNNTSFWIVPSGNALMYNHSFEPNIVWYHTEDDRIIEFKAKQDIKKDDELTFDYGPSYKYNRRNFIKVKDLNNGTR